HSSRERSSRERRREVEAADRAVEVEDLAGEEEAGNAARLERLRVDLVERDAAARHFGEVEAARAVDQQRRREEEVAEARAFAPRDFGEAPLGVELFRDQQRV